MSAALEIRFDSVSKNFGKIQAVRDLSFQVLPGRVTGFLGPNGAGKTTTLRILLNLIKSSQGTATIGGKKYHELEQPGQLVGASLESNSFHPARSAKNHLLVHAAALGVSKTRVFEVLELVGLTDAADRKVKGYSLGMRQRLGLATALLGDPKVLVLDEPINGLDPAGIRWIRDLLRSMAMAGKTILVSSHLLTEVAQTVDDVVIISAGSQVYAGTLQELADQAVDTVTVAATDPDALAQALTEGKQNFQAISGAFQIQSATALEIGAIAHKAQLQLLHLSEQKRSLEDSFLDLVSSQPQQNTSVDREQNAK